MKKSIFRFLLSFCLIGVVFLRNSEMVWADPTSTPKSVDIGKAFRIKDGLGISEKAEYENIGTFLSASIIPNVMLIANIILFFMIFASGFTIISGAGNPDKQKQASQTLTASIIGFIVIFGAYWILEALNIITGFDLGL